MRRRAQIITVRSAPQRGHGVLDGGGRCSWSGGLLTLRAPQPCAGMASSCRGARLTPSRECTPPGCLRGGSFREPGFHGGFQSEGHADLRCDCDRVKKPEWFTGSHHERGSPGPQAGRLRGGEVVESAVGVGAVAPHLRRAAGAASRCPCREGRRESAVPSRGRSRVGPRGRGPGGPPVRRAATRAPPPILPVSVSSMKRLPRVKLRLDRCACGNVGIRSVISTFPHACGRSDTHIMVRSARSGVSQPSIRVDHPRGQARRSR